MADNNKELTDNQDARIKIRTNKVESQAKGDSGWGEESGTGQYPNNSISGHGYFAGRRCKGGRGRRQCHWDN